MKNYKFGPIGYMALKLDMSKAYNRVEWAFLESLMLKMGFNNRWVGLIMTCIKIVTYSMMVNGEPKGLINPMRGLRQGDPFPPFLFLLCMEGLHGLIQKAALIGDITGFALCRRGPKITHLFFVDNSLLFCRATTRECETVMELLSEYENVSGQKVNWEKTTFFLVGQSIKLRDRLLRGFWGLERSTIMKNIWDFPR